jgi:hypothetical protein
MLPIHQCFTLWLAATAAAAFRPLLIAVCDSEALWFSFEGMTPIVAGFLSETEITIHVDWEDDCWDLIYSEDIDVKSDGLGFFCGLCEDQDVIHFPDVETLWRKHVFEPFLDWSCETLRTTSSLALYGGQGITEARIIPEDVRPPPELLIAVLPLFPD